MFKRQKIPARKKVYCYKHGKALLSHKEHYWAERELEGLQVRFPKAGFEIRRCEYCGKLHVFKMENDDNQT